MKFLNSIPAPLRNLMQSERLSLSISSRVLVVIAPPDVAGAIAFILPGYLARAGASENEFDSVKTVDSITGAEIALLDLPAAAISEQFYLAQSRNLLCATPRRGRDAFAGTEDAFASVSGG